MSLVQCVLREMEIRLLQLIVGDCYRPMVACCPLLIGPLFVLAEDFPYSEILQIRIGVVLKCIGFGRIQFFQCLIYVSLASLWAFLMWFCSYFI